MYSAHKEGPPIGVDFGSQSCRCYVWKNGRTIQIGPGSFTNLVALKDHLMHGRDALKELDNRHCNVVRHTTASMKTRRPIQMEHPSAGQREFEVDELLAFLLNSVRRGAMKALGADISRACVSLPLALTAVERSRFIASSIAANYNSFELVPSTAMGALYWAHCTRVLGTPDVRRDVLVLDVGCRFTSISIVRLSHSAHSTKEVKIELLASRTLREGGYSTDLALCSYLESAIGAQGINDVQLINASEKAKKELSALKDTSLQVREHKHVLTKEELDIAAETFVMALKSLIRCVLVEHPNIDLAVLIGGASRMNSIQSYVRNIFKLTVDVVDCDYAAVMGASIFANSVDIKLEVVERSFAFDYWVCSTDGVIRKIFVNGNQEVLPDKAALGGWWVFQRLKGSSPGPEPNKEELVMCALQPRGDPTYSRVRTDALPDDGNDPCADSSRPPPMELPKPEPPVVKQIFLRREPHEPIGLQLRKIESRIIIIEVKPGSASAKQGFARYAGWLLTHAQDTPIMEIKQLQNICEGKTDINLTVQSPGDWHVQRPMEFIGTCEGGCLVLQTSGLIKGLVVPVPPVMDEMKIDETRTMLGTELERAEQMQQFAEVRNDLDEVIIRGDEIHPSQLNKYCSNGEELLMMAGVMLEHTTRMSRKKKLAKLQLAKMYSLSKLMLKMLDLQEAGKTSGGEKVKEMEAEFQKAAQALDDYDSADEYEDRPGSMRKLRKGMSISRKSLRKKSTMRQSSGSPIYNKTYTGKPKVMRTVESVYHKKSHSPDREAGLHRSMSSNGLSGRHKEPQSPSNRGAASVRKAVIEELRAASRQLDTYTALTPIPRTNTGIFSSPSRMSPKQSAASPVLRPGSPRHLPINPQLSPNMSPKRVPASSPRRGRKKKKKPTRTFENIDSDSATSTLDMDEGEGEGYTSDDASDDVQISGIPVTTSVFKPRNDSFCSPPRSPSRKELRLSRGVPQSVKDALERAGKKPVEKGGSEPGSPVLGLTRKRSSTMGAMPLLSKKESMSFGSPQRREEGDLPKRPASRFSIQKRPPLHPSASNSSGSPKPDKDKDKDKDDTDTEKKLSKVSKPLSRSIKGITKLPSIDTASESSTACGGRRDSVSSMPPPRTSSSAAKERGAEKARQEQKRLAGELLKLEVKFEKEGRDKVLIDEWKVRDSISDEKRVNLRDTLIKEEKAREERKQKEEAAEEQRRVLCAEEEAERIEVDETEATRWSRVLEQEEELKEAIAASELLISGKKFTDSFLTVDSAASPTSSNANTGTFSSPQALGTPTSRPRKPSAHVPRVAGISPIPFTKKTAATGPKNDKDGSSNVPRVAALAAPPQKPTSNPQPKQHDINIASAHVPRVAQMKAKPETFSTPPKPAPKAGPTVPPPKRTTSPLHAPARSPSPRSRSPIKSGTLLAAHTAQLHEAIEKQQDAGPQLKASSVWKEDMRPPPLQTDNSSQSSSQRGQPSRSKASLESRGVRPQSGGVSAEHEPPLRGIVKDSTTPKLTPKAGKVTIQKLLPGCASMSTSNSDMMLKSNGTTPAVTPGRGDVLPSFESATGSPLRATHSSDMLFDSKPMTPSSSVPAAVKQARTKRTLSPRGMQRMADSQIIVSSSSDFDKSVEELNKTMPCIEIVNVRSECVTEDHPPPQGPKKKKEKTGNTGTYGKPREPEVKSTPAFRRMKEKQKLGSFSKSMPLIRRGDEDGRRKTATSTVGKKKDPVVTKSTKRGAWAAPAAGPTFSGKASSRSATSHQEREYDGVQVMARRRGGKSPQRPGVSPVSFDSSRRSVNSSESPAARKRSRSAAVTHDEDRDVLIDKLRSQLKTAGLQTSAAVPR